MREIYVGDGDARARAEAHPYVLQYRYTQFTCGGKLPDSCDFWSRQAPMLHAMSFDEIVTNNMVILGSAFVDGLLAVALEHQVRGAPDVDFRYHATKANGALSKNAYPGLANRGRKCLGVAVCRQY
jgi:hypothetical protein